MTCERNVRSGEDPLRPASGSSRILLKRVTHSPEETVNFGRELAKNFPASTTVLLEGELGSGKTTLVKGIVACLAGISEEEVTSPSFTLVHEYGRENKVYHVDLYRIEGRGELPSLGLDDLEAEGATVLIEWGEKFGGEFPEPCFRIRMEHLGDDERQIVVERLGA